jgi:hypothetical protein
VALGRNGSAIILVVAIGEFHTEPEQPYGSGPDCGAAGQWVVMRLTAA